MSISITEPTVGGSSGTWGTQLNTALSTIVAGVNAAQDGAQLVALGSQASTVVCDLSQGTVFTVTLTGNAVVSFINWPAGVEVEPVLYLTQDGTGSRTVTWTGVTWQPGGVAPTLQTAPGATDIIGLSSPDAGAHVYGQTGIVVGTAAGTVMAGNDSRVVGAASAASLATTNANLEAFIASFALVDNGDGTATITV